MDNKVKVFLPNFKKYNIYLRRIWRNKQVANDGPMVRELEVKLKKYLGVKHLFLVSSGTMAIQLAIKALDLQGEIITAPLSFIATPSAIEWQGCVPVFVDINEMNLTIDPKKIEDKITPRTKAILPVHLFGYPCEMEKIHQIAKKYRLKVIYDGSHAFGVKYKGRSVFDFGDISTVSFNETKLFHMAEGGAIITGNDKIAEKIKQMRHFGLSDKREFVSIGINAKSSELNAALGLTILPKTHKIINDRKKWTHLYDKLLNNTNLEKPKIKKNTSYNFSYYPVIFSSEAILLKALKQLHKNNIFPERFFYPSLNAFTFFGEQAAPVAEDIAKRMICLPLYCGLSKTRVEKVCKIIKSCLN
ncbi:MAG TPA: DegT/DnrJ/EryC1/StrS family aminotransferase [Candidatus Portnoybacteria bacterium]|nr:DegT/DnrJ/EryC1/StrS family aminotransferase [Candidatus Portnoybacteria bacterium]